MSADPTSYSNFEDASAKELDIKLEVDFKRKILKGVVTFVIDIHHDDTSRLVLDTRDLVILNVVAAESGERLEYTLGDAHPAFGSPLTVQLPDSSANRYKLTIAIQYETKEPGPSAVSAMQWLEPTQTAGKIHPYLFTQCQAIHARSMLPCQDTPAVKCSYVAEITVPSELTALMSAVKLEDKPSPESDKKICQFKQAVAIPSYLIALVVGALESRQIGPRSHVWSEKEVVESAAYEFAETEQMLQAAESIVGPYLWGVYDLVVLPPSFPYGGMENPCLTFVTPTLLAGDRSLANVVAHEISHSWTGNLVTNKTWEHFWLNEGFTVFLERKIAAVMHGEKERQFQAIGGWKTLQDSVNTFGSDNPLTALVPVLKDVDPDDAFSTVPYEKGFALLYYLESLLGGAEVFNKYLRAHVEHFKYKVITTDDWKSFFLSYFHKQVEEGVLDGVEWDKWLYSPGMPPYNPSYDPTLSAACHSLADQWAKASASDLNQFKASDLESFTAKQTQEFLDKLLQEQSPLSCEHLKAMETLYQMNSRKNAEIRFRWQKLCLKSSHEDCFPHVVKFLVEQGRMKFVRPLYREFYKCPKSQQLAVETFKQNKHAYHAIAASLIEKDISLK
ncbi:leukotriene A-4 hydrolase-like [Dysidea avara]|uniref:leukotriene A-4 hydrolase-like n=1 Tax=Dysidea avara TaxID=196820 RepID=UPI00331DB561